MMTSLQTSLRSQKRALRKAVAIVLNAIPPQSIEAQSKSVTEKVLALSHFGEASKGVSCYLSMPTGEVATSTLVSSILRQADKQLFVPKIINKDGIMDFYEIFNQDDLTRLPSGTWGIQEPESHWEGRLRTSALTSESPTLDIIVLPGVAFDRSFSRLGHGKGYYDRFISTYTATGRRKPLLVGLALREQLLTLGAVPMGEHDWKMDIVVTPDEVLVNDQASEL